VAERRLPTALRSSSLAHYDYTTNEPTGKRRKLEKNKGVNKFGDLESYFCCEHCRFFLCVPSCYHSSILQCFDWLLDR
jgi:hypothetical protein